MNVAHIYFADNFCFRSFLKALRACLYERRDGTFTGTGRCLGSRHVCFYSFYRILFIWRRDVFRPVSSSQFSDRRCREFCSTANTILPTQFCSTANTYIVNIIFTIYVISLPEQSSRTFAMDDLRFRKIFVLGITKDITRKKLSKLEKLQSLVAKCCKLR